MSILHSYKTVCKTVKQPPGLADFIMGTMSLFSHAKTQVLVNYKDHPIYNFIENKHPLEKLEEFDSDPIEFFNKPFTDFIQFLAEIQTPTHIYTNCRQYTVTAQLQDFIKNCFTPKKHFQELIQNTLKALNLQNFITIHIRMGDQNMFKDLIEFDNCFQQIIFSLPKGENLFITSDNSYTKNFFSKQSSLFKTINNKPIHLGDLLNAELLDVQHTLLDFFIMSYSRQIISYSIYGGTGFSKVCSDIYGIPFSVHYLPL